MGGPIEVARARYRVSGDHVGYGSKSEKFGLSTTRAFCPDEQMLPSIATFGS